MRCYVFDLDGTIADLSHRLHHVQKQPKDWRAFFSAEEVLKDKPIRHICDLIDALWYVIDASYVDEPKIIIVSGRSDECREATLRWLDTYEIPHHGLYMRRAGDHRPDNVVKLEILKELQALGYKPIMAFDDRDQVVKMWRENGVPCAQVAEGSF